jgi:uncharacterized cofD-like protein
LNHRSRIEKLVEAVLSGPIDPIAKQIHAFDARGARVVILGGGTGLSTVVGGNSAAADWADHPFLGLKEEFDRLDVVVCTTDDGGSTGELLKQLPMIGIGDLRKSCLSLVREPNLRTRYGLDAEGARATVALLQRVFNTRLPRDGARDIVEDPVLAAGPELAGRAPAELRAFLAALGRVIAPRVELAGNALGNLILTAAVFRAAGERFDRPPDPGELQTGLDQVAAAVGTTPGRLHAATAAPGQLKFRYASGVEVYGQKKAGLAQRGFPVESVTAEFSSEPAVSEALLIAIREADLVIYAPGSVYSSILPVLQLDPIVEAIRSNRAALKVLGANFWIQRGETDMSLRNQARGFLVSELIEAYHDNIPGGIHDLFEIVLCANLEHVPGNVLGSYALEGKQPIHLDREQVESMGLCAVEATLYSPDRLELPGGIRHDATNFALAVRTLLFARQRPEALGGEAVGGRVRLAAASRAAAAVTRRDRPPLCGYLASVRAALDTKVFEPPALRDVLLELAWDNRDIQPAHLRAFAGARLVATREWSRGPEWNNVLGYYDPEDRWLDLHESLARDPERLRACLLIALGESLLGRYLERRSWAPDPTCGGGIYEIRLRDAGQRDCYLSDEQLRSYLRLARMAVDAADPAAFRIGVHGDEGFLPPGLLFGLLFAWYLSSDYGGVMEYEMSLLHWPPESLMPHHARERARKQRLVEFFRHEVFGHLPAGSR